MIFRTLKLGELDRWAEHCSSVFAGPTDTPDYFRNHFILDPTHDENGVFIAEEDGEIASTLRVFRREMWMQGERVSMGGIGEVSTKMQFRKRGLSGELLKMAIDYMVREQLVTSKLGTSVNGHYSRYGWFTLPIRQVHLAPKANAELSIRPMADGDLPNVMAMHEDFIKQYDGFITRDAEYWTKWMTFAWKKPHVVMRGGAVVGYIDADFSEQDKTLYLHDFAADAGDLSMADCLSAWMDAYQLQGNIVMPAAKLGMTDLPLMEQRGSMVRLNAPFTLNGDQIDSPAKLMAALSDMAFFGADGF